MPIDVKQYDSAIDFIDENAKFTKLVGNLSNNDDRMRLKAYELYEDMYHNRPEHIRITLRGGSGEDCDDDDSIEIYLPSAKKCIEAVNRFLCVNFEIIPDPTMELGANAAEVAGIVQKIFKRERMTTKFAQLKRYMLIKGDALLHIYANPNRPPGRRICIDELKPEHYYPIEDQVTGETTGCYIVDVIPNPKNTEPTKLHTSNQVVRRQRYQKLYDEAGNPTGEVTSELALYEVGKWDERVLEPQDIRRIEVLREEYTLPPEITQLPVYHWRNNPLPCSTFGLSELAGVETVVNALNQSMSDEDLTLIMQGLGVYWTDASPPMNDKGEEVEWEISPRSVVQVASGGQFNRVTGVTTIQPFGDHIKALDEAMQQALGVPDIAIGVVDVATAESGISLLLKLGPLLAKNAEKEAGDLSNVTDQFIFDLIDGWLPAYEGIETDGVFFVAKFDDPMPKNKSKDLADLLSIWTQANATAQILPISWFFEQLNDIMGYHLDPTTDFQQALQEAQIAAEAMAPPVPEPPPGEPVGASSGGPSTNGQGG